MKGWNHRVLAHEHNGEIYLKIHEVYYNDKDMPDTYTVEGVSIGSEDLKGLRWTLNRMKQALKKTILWAGDKFPQEYKK